MPGAVSDVTNPNEPGSYHWWLSRLGGRLMDRQELYDVRENYENGNHPIPYGDRRYVKALAEFQNKARTNYISLIQQAVTQKMRQKDFKFGVSGEADDLAKRIWQASDMDFQAPSIIQTAAKMGFAFAIVDPPTTPGGLPEIYLRDPRLCEIERDRNRPTKTLAGLELWVDEPSGQAFAILHLPDVEVHFASQANRTGFIDALNISGIAQVASSFDIVEIVPNPLGEVRLQRCDWVPSAGERGRASGEEVWDVQDRLNKTVLDRLVLSNSQAYRQRWATGAPKPKDPKVKARPPWEPGADVLWLSSDPNTKFGDFEEADIKQILEAIRDDVGDMAAMTQTPATFLVNRLINVSGDTIQQASSGHVARVQLHQDSVGFFFERILKLAFKMLGDARANDPGAQTIWWPVYTHSLAESADAFQKFVASGVPLQLAMQMIGMFTDEDIQFAVAEAEKTKAEEKERASQEQEVALKMKTQTQPTQGSGNTSAR